MPTTTFYTPRNNATTTLLAHTNGSGSLTVASGTGTLFGTPSPGAPIRVTVVSATSGLLTIFSCTAVSGDTLSGLTTIEGTTDRTYAGGDLVEMRPTAGTFSDVHTAVNALEANPYIVQTTCADLPNAQALAALATGLVKVTTTTGVLSTASPGTDYLTPSGNGSGLTALNASNLSSGTVAAARMPALTGDVTSSAGAVATTLATVNSNVGSFTNAGVTVNAKGLVTAASSGPTPLLASNNLSDVTAATARTNLGLGTIATQAANSVAITGGTIDGVALGPHGGTRATSNSGAFDLSAADWFVRTLDGTNGTLTVSNEKVNQVFTVELLQDGTGSRTISFASFGTVTWMTSGGTEPAIAGGAGLLTTFLFKRTAAATFLGWLTGTQA